MFVWKRRLKGENNPDRIRELFGKSKIMIRNSVSFINEGEADNYAQTYLKSEPLASKIAVHFIEKEGEEFVGYWLIAWSANLKMPESLADVLAINPDTPTKVWHRLRCGICQRPVSSGFQDQIFVCAAITCFECVNADADTDIQPIGPNG